MQAIEMQCVPEHAPNSYLTSAGPATQATNTKQRPSSLMYVPLKRRTTPVFFSKRMEDKWRAQREAEKRQLRLRLNLLRIYRVLSFSLISLNHVTILALLLTSLGLGSGSVWESLFQIPGWLSLITIAAFLCHRLKYRMFQMITMCNLAVYATLFILALSSAALFTLRIQRGLMCREFIRLERNSCHVPQFMVAISWITVALAAAGIPASHFYGKLGRPEEQKPQPLHDPFQDCNIPKIPPPAKKRRCDPEREHPFLRNIRYGERISEKDLRSYYPPLCLLYHEIVKRVEEAQAGGRPFSIEEEYDLWYERVHGSSRQQASSYSNYYLDMPPPRKVEAAELEDGWIDVPLYAADSDD
ncbi:hypothetical protein GYMLUDRAFT_71997 [Collybiopsis luxurians FD-317 M1]|uniref:Uncharacterized protein n=1 Tax=Collybiopsis luxurians FD-317 M1 TaxID=944289 RepID=A0A0D0D3L9_9AGAR|nr:hypothetical protein GYMLUDRAFT_71997 [Collybiopsis luxurians FD-317 M1]